MTKIILPKSNKETGQFLLSYSQINTFLTNKRDYFRRYFLGDKFEGNHYTDFGKQLGEAIEKNDFTAYTTTEQEFLGTIPRLDEFEKEIKLDFGEFYIVGYIDTNKKDLSLIHDYKTGTQKKIVEYQKPDYIQPAIYALALEQQYGIMPERASVILIDRLGNPFKGEKLTVGAQWWEVEIPITKKELSCAKDLIYKTACEISEYYQLFNKLNQR